MHVYFREDDVYHLRRIYIGPLFFLLRIQVLRLQLTILL
jgi:hypothetical protein